MATAAGDPGGTIFGHRARPQISKASSSPLNVLDFGPTGRAREDVRMLKVRFNRAVVPLGAQEMRDAGDVVRVSPLVPGHSVWRGADLLVFEPADGFPPATRFDVSLDPKLAAYDGARLEHPLHWQLETLRPWCRADVLSDRSENLVGPSEPLLWSCSLPLVEDRWSSLVSATVDGKPWPVRAGLLADEEGRLRAWAKQQDVSLDLRFPLGLDRSQRNVIVVWPREAWPADSRIDLTIASGLRSSAGPLPSDEPLRFSARGSPVPTPISARCGGDLELVWSTPLREAESAAIRIEPRTYGTDWLPVWSRDEKSAAPRWLAAYALPQPGASYDITVPAGLVDVFGRRVAAEWTRRVTCEIPEPSAAARLADRQGTLERSKPWIIGIESSGISSARARVAAFDWDVLVARPQVYWDTLEWLELGRGESADRNPSAPTIGSLGGGLVERRLDFDEREEGAGQPLDLAELAGRRARLFAVSVDGNSLPEQRGFFNVADVGLVAWLGPGRSAIQAFRLSTGDAWSGGEIHAAVPGRPLVGIGRTDADGVASFTSWPDKQAPEARLLLFARRGDEQAVLPIAYLDGRDTPQPGPNPGDYLLGELVTERFLFLPGETVHFVGWAGIATVANADGLRPLPTEAKATVALKYLGMDSDASIVRKAIPLDGHGKLWGEIALPKEARLGNYHVEVKIPWRNGNDVDGLTTPIRVAAFRPAEVEVEARLNGKGFGPGQTPRLVAKANHLYGGEAQLVSAEVERECRAFFPVEERWHVGPKHNFRNAGERDRFAVAASDLRHGSFSLELPTLSPHPYLPARCSLRVSVQDHALRSTSTETQFELHPTRFYLGLRSRQPSGEQALEVQVRGMTLDGRTVPVRDVVLTLRDYGGERVLRSVRVDASRAKPALVRLARLPPGGYLLSVEAMDEGRRMLTSDAAYVGEANATPDESADEPLEERNPLALQLAKRADVGKPLRIHLRAPEGVRTGTVAVMRDGLRELRTVRFVGGAADVTLTAKEAWAPEARLEAIALLPSKHEPVRLLRREATVAVDMDHRRLRVRVVGPRQAMPGQEVAYDVRVADDNGRAATAAHVAAWAVDEGVLALADLGLPDLVQGFAPSNPYEATSVDNLGDVLAPFDPKAGLRIRRAHAPDVIPGLANVSEQRPEPSLRHDFQTTPLFVGDAPVDSGGKAHLRFRLPHNLTRYRLTVVASAELGRTGVAARFGTAEATVETAIPVSLRPLLPRFLRMGDRSEAVVVAHNRTSQPKSLDIVFAAASAGPHPVLTAVGEARRTVVLAADEERRIAFQVEAKAAGEATVRWSARPRAGSAAVDGDAVQLPLRVIAEPPPIDRVAMGGFISAGERQDIPTQLPVSAPRLRDSDTLDIRLATSPVEDLHGVVAALVNYPYHCGEQTTTRLLPFLLFPALATAAGHTTVEKATAEALAKLDGLTVGPGYRHGLRFWHGAAPADPFVTAWALLVLGHADGQLLPLDLRSDLAQAVTELSSTRPGTLVALLARLALNEDGKHADYGRVDPGKEHSLLNTALAVLAITAKDASASAEVRAQRVRQARVWLAQAIAQTPEHARVIHCDARNVAADFPTASHALVEAALAWAFVRAWPDHPATWKLLRAAAEHRRGDAWNNTLENAFVLLAAHELEGQRSAAAVPSFTIVADGRALIPWRQIPAGQSAWSQTLPLSGLPGSFFSSPSTAPGILQLAAGPQADLFFGLAASYAASDSTAVDDGFSIRRRFRFPMDHQGDLSSTQVGALLAVDVVLKTSLEAEHVAVEVPIPAGLEAVDPALSSDALAIPGKAVRYQDAFLAHSELLPERALLFLRRVWAGESRFTFFARAVSAGRFAVPATRVEAMYSPEIRGRGTAADFTVLPVAAAAL